MGFGTLVLVDPKYSDVAQLPQAQALASGATDVLASMQIVPTLAEALAPVSLAFALTARVRELGPPPCDIRQAANLGGTHLYTHENSQIAIVLGTERTGLTNEDITQCQRICHIPANPLYSSLNVSQALQLAAWEMRYALVTLANLPLLPQPPGHGHPGDAPATNQAVDRFIEHWQQALVTIGFLDPAHPKRLMPRMHHLFMRCGLSQDETDMLRGVCSAIIDHTRQDKATDSVEPPC